jgi:hypothetical protein
MALQGHHIVAILSSQVEIAIDHLQAALRFPDKELPENFCEAFCRAKVALSFHDSEDEHHFKQALE